MTHEQSDAKKISRGISTDMSPEAATRRLQICSDLSAACRELGKAKVIDGAVDTADGQLRTAAGPIIRAET